MTVTAPPQANKAHRAALEAARRRTALQVDTLTHAVVALDDEVGWARLTELGTRSTVVAQQTATTATADLLNATLNAADLVGDVTSLPGIQPGRLASGNDVRGMFAATRDIVARRMTAPGVDFPAALDASANKLVAIASSEPHRIGRDGQLNLGMVDERFNRYRRVAVGNTCSFCLMLATRGAVYLTAASAGQSRKYHAACDCEIVMVLDASVTTSRKARTSPAPFSDLSKDWRAAIRDKDRLNAADIRREWADLPDAEVARAAAEGSREAIEEMARRTTALVDEVPVTVATPAAPRFDADSVQRLANADLDNELTAAYNASDDAAADLLEAEMNRRQKWADGWGRNYDEYDDWRPLDDLADEADLPYLDDLPEPPKVSRRAVRAEWEADQELRMYDAELEGGGIHPQLRTEAQSKGITLATLMNGDPRTAYKYANQELLGWWARNGRNPLYELEAKHGRLDSTALAKARMTESRARERAERLLGKDRREGVAQLDAERRAANRRRGV